MKKHFHLSDLQVAARLAAKATTGLTDIVENMHRSISPLSSATGVPGLVYGGIRGIANLVGKGADLSLRPFAGILAQDAASPERDAIVAAINGVIGDHLAEDGNPLAITMALRYHGKTLPLTKEGLKAVFPKPNNKLLIMVHGLCMSDLQWNRKGYDHGQYLAHETGYTTLYLKFNSGLHIAANGERFAALLEELHQNWPGKIKDIVIVGHSMGGLVSRSAIYFAEQKGYRWPEQVSKLFFLGTPHHGAPLERGGNLLETSLGAVPYASSLARLGRLRSAGITDLRYGYLLGESLQAGDRFARTKDLRQKVPLPTAIKCYAIAATTATGHPADGKVLPGDGLVPVYSAFGQHKDEYKSLGIPSDRQWLVYNTHHIDLLYSEQVAAKVAAWIKE